MDSDSGRARWNAFATLVLCAFVALIETTQGTLLHLFYREKGMARTAKRIHISTLDPKFVRERNPDCNWLIERFNENISLLDKLANNLPKSLPWRTRTVEQLQAEAAQAIEKGHHLDAYRHTWQDLLEQVQAFGLLSALRLIEPVS
jgi:hypothetical protein